MDTKIRAVVNILLMIVLVQLIEVRANAQSWQKSPVIISGKIVNALLTEQDSLIVKLHKDAVIFGEQIFSLPLSKKGEFCVRIDSIDHPAQLGFGIKGGRYLLFNGLIEPGDTLFLQIEISGDKSIKQYSGNNFLKYAVTDSLKIENLSFTASRSAAENATELQKAKATGNYKNVHQFYNKKFNALLAILDRNKNSISPALREYLKAQYSYFYLGVWEMLTKISFDEAENNEIRESIIKGYQRYASFDYNFDQNQASYNQYYLQYLILKCKTYLLINNPGHEYTYKDVYNKLKTSYSGFIQERLLTFFLIDYKSSIDVVNYDANQFDTCLMDAISRVRNPYLRSLLLDKINLKKGSPAFNFSMIDTLSHIVKLSDLKGKVVLLDMWAEGCTGCAIFAQMFNDKIFNVIKKDVSFEMVSVSVDRTKEGWFRGIKSGKYTTKDHLNLFTEGKGLSHPFALYYKINVIPFILLIDKNGKVFSKIDLGLSATELLKLIQEALEVDK